VNLNEITDPLDDVDEMSDIEFERENRSESQMIKEVSSLANGIVVITDLLVSNIAGALTGVINEHNGVDIAAPIGTQIVSPLDGTVADINTHQTGGKQLIIKHTNGYRTG